MTAVTAAGGLGGNLRREVKAMRFRNGSFVLAAVLAWTVGCSSGPDPQPTVTMEPVADSAAAKPEQSGASDAVVARRIVLTKGDSLGYSVSAEGEVRIFTTILAGKEGAGSYECHDEGLLDAARFAKNALGKPGAEVTIGVSAGGRILTIAYAQTL